MLWVLLLILLTGGIVLVLSGETATIAGLEPAAFAAAVAGVALVIAIGSSLAGSYRGRAVQAIKDLATWTAFALVLVLIYSFREEFAYVGRRIAGELLPPGETLTVTGSRAGEQAVRIRRRGDGHFVARAQVNGTMVSLLVDTGASTVVLRTADARAAGIDLERLTYSVPVQTANGATFAASVRLRALAIGPIVLENVEALVAKPGVLQESLLGMNFLRRLRSYEFSGEFLTLRS
jgi:aspartyl protease family protein